MSTPAINDEVAGFTEEQIATAAKLTAEGYRDEGILIAAGLEAGELDVLRCDGRYKELVRDLAARKRMASIETDDAWDGVEDAALALVKFDLDNCGDAMTPMEKLAIAKQANAAKRRAAEDSKNGTGGGILNGANGGGVSITSINLSLPRVLVQRLEAVNNKKDQVVENEQYLRDDFVDNQLGLVDVNDVKKILNVDLNDSAGSKQTSVEMLESAGLATVLQETDAEGEIVSGVGIADDWG